MERNQNTVSDINNGPRYSIKTYILILVFASTIGFWGGFTLINYVLGHLLGAGCQGLLRITVMTFPVLIFCILYGFYKGLVKHYGFKSDENLFFGGKF